MEDLVLEKKVKWGVIGSGGIARRRTIPEGILSANNSTLVSVFDINKTENNKLAKDFSATPYSDIYSLLDSDIDVVYVASPVNNHLEHVTTAAKYKKHVFCEKPLGLSVDEAEKMIAVCQENGVLLGTGFMMRFLSQHREALKLLNEGNLGKPVFCRAQLSCWFPPMEGAWRQDPALGGGGSLIDMGSHCIDLLEMFFGEIKSVSCRIGSIVHSYKSEDSAVILLFFKNGAMGVVDAYFCIPDNSSKNVLELYGSKGSVIGSGTIGQESSGSMTAYLEQGNSGYSAQQIRDADAGVFINPIPVNTYRAEIEDFGDAILKRRTPLNNSSIGLQNQKILAACYESAKTGKIIDI